MYTDRERRGGGYGYRRDERRGDRDRGQRDDKRRELDELVRVKVEKLFNKRCVVPTCPGTQESVFTANVWDDESLNELKEDLNKTKNKLDEKTLSEWSKHTKFNRVTAKVSCRDEVSFFQVVWHVKDAVEPEMATIAWLKMYEILAVCSNLFC